MPKTWEEKFNSITAFHIKVLDVDFADMKKGQTMLIATPEIIDGYIHNIKKGTATDIKTMRKDLALKFNTDVTCPVTTGIYTRIVAEKSYNDFLLNKDKITPIWRIIDPKSLLAKKLSFGIEFITKKRLEEDIL